MAFVDAIKRSKYKTIKLTQLACVIYILVLTFRPYTGTQAGFGGGLLDPAGSWGNWQIVDVWNEENTARGVIQIDGDPNGQEHAVVAANTASLLFLGASRISAFIIYPCMFLVYMTKCKATINHLMKSPISLFMVDDQHELHAWCGKFIAYCVIIHTFFHCLRWGIQGDIRLLWTNTTGITGLIVVLVCPLITFPMFIPKIRLALTYEIRKSMHYLFYVFALSLCWHNQTSAWPDGGYCQIVMGFSIAWYTLDSLYVIFFMTEMIQTTVFNVLPSGVQMTMAVSKNFQKSYAQGGYGYVCLPWVSKYQWHAFSLFEHPTDGNLRQVFIMKTKGGDWTHDVHDQLQRDTVRPVWISGPFISPYNNALGFDNQICVASGIGITPALSVIRAHKASRRVNLIWACRDEAMLEFFMEHLWLNNDGWILIFYTGKQELSAAIENANSNVKLIKARPDLHMLIPNIIYGIESGKGVPETYIPGEKVRLKEALIERLEELEDDGGLTEDEIVEELRLLVQESGFLLSNLVSNGEESGGKSILETIKENYGGPGGTRKSQFKGRGTTINRKSMAQTRKARQTMMAIGYQPWEKQEGAKEFVKILDKKTVLDTWGMLYCGGSKPVEHALEKISGDYQIGLHPESFAW